MICNSMKCHGFRENVTPHMAAISVVAASSVSHLNHKQKEMLKEVQERVCRIILSPSYTSYQEAFNTLVLLSLSNHHLDLIIQFESKLPHHSRYRHLLSSEIPRIQVAVRHYNCIDPIRACTERYKNSPIPAIVGYCMVVIVCTLPLPFFYSPNVYVVCIFSVYFLPLAAVNLINQ